eukprot:tig00001041_g6559.t1
MGAVPEMAPLVPRVRAELQTLAEAVVRATEGKRVAAEETMRQIEGLLEQLEAGARVLEARRGEIEALKAQVREQLATYEPMERGAKADAASITPAERGGFAEIVALASPPAGVRKAGAALATLLRPGAARLDADAAYALFKRELWGGRDGWPRLLAALHGFNPRAVPGAAMERLAKVYLADPELDEARLAAVSSVAVKVVRYLRAMEKYYQLFTRGIRPAEERMARLEADVAALSGELAAAARRAEAARAARRRSELELEGLQGALELAAARRALLDAQLGAGG